MEAVRCIRDLTTDTWSVWQADGRRKPATREQENAITFYLLGRRMNKATRKSLQLDQAVDATLAKVGPDGSWRLHSIDDAPALILSGDDFEPRGTEFWAVDGYIDRDRDLPARIVQERNTRYWYRRSQHHRDPLPQTAGRPAIESSIRQQWKVDGLSHRLDGPANLSSGAPLMWAVNGTTYTYEVVCLLEEMAANACHIGNVFQEPSAPAAKFEMRHPDGEVVGIRTIPSALWLTWIQANAERYFPELAAAMRARGMVDAMRGAVPQRVAPATTARRSVSI